MNTRFKKKLTQSNVKNRLFSVASLPDIFPPPGSPITIVDENGKEYTHRMHNKVKRIDGMALWYNNHPDVTSGSEIEITRLGDGKFFIRPVVDSIEVPLIAEQRPEDGQGFHTSHIIRKTTEDYAMHKAEEYFRNLGYDVEDVSRRESFDLLCTCEDEEIHLEVKGTQTAGSYIILTRNEVRHARENKGQMALYVLHSISIREEKEKSVASGGKPIILNPWNIEDGKLVPMEFRYRLPNS